MFPTNYTAMGDIERDALPITISGDNCVKPSYVLPIAGFESMLSLGRIPGCNRANTISRFESYVFMIIHKIIDVRRRSFER